MEEIVGYEVREDVLDDGTPVFDVYQLMDGDSECVDVFRDKDLAVKSARTCARDNGLGDIEVKIYRPKSVERGAVNGK